MLEISTALRKKGQFGKGANLQGIFKRLWMDEKVIFWAKLNDGCTQLAGPNYTVISLALKIILSSIYRRLKMLCRLVFLPQRHRYIYIYREREREISKAQQPAEISNALPALISLLTLTMTLIFLHHKN